MANSETLTGRMRTLAATAVAAVAVGICLIMPSCNTTGCTENQNSVPLAGFYSFSADEPISIDSIEIGGVGAPGDSLLTHAGTPVSQVYLPLRSTATTTSFYVRYRQKALDFEELNDTLTFDYESHPWFASEECGAMYHYRITRLEYTKHLIDSIGLTDSLVTNLDIETIRIFFRTADKGEEDENPDDGPESDTTNDSDEKL